jgi:acyl-CoA thioester hydrolase
LKPSPHRLDLSTYPFVTEIPTRFGDMDPLRHLNNVALAGIYEEGRVRFGLSVNDSYIHHKGHRLVIAEVNIRYLAEGHYPGALTVAAGVIRVGASSYVLAQALFQNGQCIGVCDSVLVYTAEHRPHPLPDGFKAALLGKMIADAATTAAQ